MPYHNGRLLGQPGWLTPKRDRSRDRHPRHVASVCERCSRARCGAVLVGERSARYDPERDDRELERSGDGDEGVEDFAVSKY